MKRWKLGGVLALSLTLTGGSVAYAAKEKVCAAPSALTQAGFALPRLAKALSGKLPAGADKTVSADKSLVADKASAGASLDGKSLSEKPLAEKALAEKALAEGPPTSILVLNSATPKKKASKPGAEKDTTPRSFPSFIEERLRERYPDRNIVLTTQNRPRATAQAILAGLPKLLEQTRPALMIWQTGTYDAILGADTAEFSTAVETGIALAHAAGADVLIVSPQYSPRTAFAFDVAPYNNALRWATRTARVPFFDRYDVMQFWDEEGIFDFDLSRPSPSMFEDVHRCIGRLMVGMIVDGVGMRTLGAR
ncbi:SGNH/GDSL hydrolase family protein [Ancylobacter sp. MQZ15Z-1]|uniref:SGNH/GDSL hydrolase family protein n=1 Tax=Ancylobacter mangrovi TaxID=2972472 RepID=A0A9X2P7K0_9HYPH|nr:SGNH/GDSL hydrolase family protein [Ancylobacter mangrovi]MCS0493692.1 SGNH/GDSL hydrolase family protein [Ancylobacter mangrovi]